MAGFGILINQDSLSTVIVPGMGIWMMIENLIPIEPLTCVTGVFVEKLLGCRWLAHWQNPQWWCQASGVGGGKMALKKEEFLGTNGRRESKVFKKYFLISER